MCFLDNGRDDSRVSFSEFCNQFVSHSLSLIDDLYYSAGLFDVKSPIYGSMVVSAIYIIYKSDTKKVGKPVGVSHEQKLYSKHEFGENRSCCRRFSRNQVRSNKNDRWIHSHITGHWEYLPETTRHVEMEWMHLPGCE